MESKPDTTLFLGATPEQVSTLVSHLTSYGSPGWIRRAPDAKLIADMMVYGVANLRGLPSGRTGVPAENLAYDYAHELRRELSRRKLPPVPDLRIPRCEICKHGTERLFPTTPATHNIVGSDGKPVNAKVCVRCWSGLHTGDSEESE